MRAVLSDEDLAAIGIAVTDAERMTSGQVRVHFDRQCMGDAIAEARRVFLRLGMDRTRHRNAVLLYLALEGRRFAVVGDEGIHARVGPVFWDDLRDELQRALRAGRLRDGVVAAVGDIGRALGRHFPDRPDDVNELPDSVSFT